METFAFGSLPSPATCVPEGICSSGRTRSGSAKPPAPPKFRSFLLNIFILIDSFAHGCRDSDVRVDWDIKIEMSRFLCGWNTNLLYLEKEQMRFFNSTLLDKSEVTKVQSCNKENTHKDTWALSLSRHTQELTHSFWWAIGSEITNRPACTLYAVHRSPICCQGHQLLSEVFV